MRRLTDRQIPKLERRAKRYTLPDPELRGHVLRIPPDGPISFTAVARRKKPFENGRQIWHVVGQSNFMALDEARGLVREVVRRIRLGLPLEDRPLDSFATVANKWLERVVEAENHRSGKESARVVRKYLLPRLGDRDFTTIARSDLADILDEIADNHGKAQADHALKRFAAIANWWAARTDGYQSPVVRGMRKGKVAKRARILNDDEIRAVWATGNGFIQFALLCGQRYGKIADLKWSDIDQSGVWAIRRAPREKNVPDTLQLSRLARAVVDRQLRITGTDHIFGPLHNREVDRMRKQSGTTGWTIHDCRRTHRSLLSRCGVNGEVGERILGHAVGSGQQQVYDRHTFAREMNDALERLGNLVGRILNPPHGNVVALGAVMGRRKGSHNKQPR
jgi:integrase